MVPEAVVGWLGDGNFGAQIADSFVADEDAGSPGNTPTKLGC